MRAHTLRHLPTSQLAAPIQNIRYCLFRFMFSYKLRMLIGNSDSVRFFVNWYYQLVVQTAFVYPMVKEPQMGPLTGTLLSIWRLKYHLVFTRNYLERSQHQLHNAIKSAIYHCSQNYL
ncbi:hypothetical protein J3Q64DRAFT_1820586 [Phycomyces blakesleeanus]|uniref:Uncharacterized protein n=1 Tax=Phycomyces blakesleeanus TaxID=4837 RepID=A0ABR3B557_PHYBL